MRARTATATLIEQDNAIDAGIKVSAHCGAAASARPTMQHQNRHAVGIAALFDIDQMSVAHINHPLIEGIDRRIKIIDCALLT